MLKNAHVIAHAYRSLHTRTLKTRLDLGRRFLGDVPALHSHDTVQLIRLKDSACSSRAKTTVSRQRSTTTPSTSHTRSQRQIRAALHTDARAQAHSPSERDTNSTKPTDNPNGRPETLRSNSGPEPLPSRTKFTGTYEDDESWKPSFMKEEMYEVMLDDLRVAMGYNDPTQTRSRSMAWTDGYTGEKPKDKVDASKGKGKREDRDTTQRAESPSNPLLKYTLPIYYRNEHLRQARVCRNDLRNLSFLEAEAKLGMASEFYLGSSFASGKTRGGRGERTERWRAKRIVEQFERETSEPPTWMRGQWKGKKERSARGDQKRGRDWFANVWGDLAAEFRTS